MVNKQMEIKKKKFKMRKKFQKKKMIKIIITIMNKKKIKRLLKLLIIQINYRDKNQKKVGVDHQIKKNIKLKKMVQGVVNKRLKRKRKQEEKWVLISKIQTEK